MSPAGPRVAFCSPLPPQISGIADYSAELLVPLAHRLPVELFSDDRLVAAGEITVPPGLPQETSLAGYRQLADRLERSAGGPLVPVYQLGNNVHFHAAIFDLLFRRPGVVVLHEFVVHHLVAALTLARGDGAAYREELRYAYGASGTAVADRCLETGLMPDPWSYPLFERVVDASLGVLVHSDSTKRRILNSRPDARVQVVPLPLSLAGLDSPPPTAAQARQRLGLPPASEAPLIASFGFMATQKRLDVALRAFAALRRRRPEARFFLVGDPSTYPGFDQLLAGGLSEGVTVTGRLDLKTFLTYMAACDVAVNLRYPSGGETSATLVRLLGLGKAVVVSDTGSFREIPDGCCARVPLDGAEEAVLAALLERLLADDELRGQLGENARRHAERRHSLEAAATGYEEFLRQIAEEVAAGRLAPYRPAPPLAPARPGDLLARLAGEVGAQLADLGLDADPPDETGAPDDREAGGWAGREVAGLLAELVAPSGEPR